MTQLTAASKLPNLSFLHDRKSGTQMQWPALQLWRLVDDGGTEMGRRKQYKALQIVKHTNVRLITNILGNDSYSAGII